MNISEIDKLKNTLLDDLEEIIIFFDENGNILYSNKYFKDFFKKEAKTIFEIDLNIKNESSIKKFSTLKDFPSKIKDKEINISYIKKVDNKNYIYKAFFMDNSSKNSLKQNKILQRRNLLLDTLMQTAPVPIFYKNTDGIYIGCNKVWRDITGFSGKNDIIGKSVYDIAPKEIADIYKAQDDKVFDLEENPQIYESKVVNKFENRTYDVLFFKSAFFDENGKVAGLIGVLLDITETKKLQNERIIQEKLLSNQSKRAAVGDMIENISHQWRQPLAVISSVISSLHIKYELNKLKDDEFVEYIETMMNNIKYLSQTIDDFRDYFKSEKVNVLFSTNEIIDLAIKIISAKIDYKRVEIIKDIEDIRIFSLKNELLQVLMNILNNAIDELEKIENRYIFIKVYRKDKNIHIEVLDNAGGIKKEFFDKIFEQYFTTKENNNGTGIGLFISKKIVEKSLKGEILASNEEFIHKNKKYLGAKFSIILKDED